MSDAANRIRKALDYYVPDGGIWKPEVLAALEELLAENQRAWSQDQVENLMAENEQLKTVLRTYVECADWYRRCLEDMIDRRPVRGLDEARVGYDQALDAARKALDV